MNFRNLLLFLIPALLTCTTFKKNESTVDINLIIPGEQAEGYRLGEIINNIGSSEYIKNSATIETITGIRYFRYLKFDGLITSGSAVLFVDNRKVVAIAGLKTERRVTSEAVLLSRGIDNCILSYGNMDLTVIKSDNHTAYIYYTSGIAFFDDNSDNIIDMYLIFIK